MAITYDPTVGFVTQDFDGDPTGGVGTEGPVGSGGRRIGDVWRTSDGDWVMLDQRGQVVPYRPQTKPVNNTPNTSIISAGGRQLLIDDATGETIRDLGPVTYAPAAGRSSDPDLPAQHAFTADENEKTRQAAAAAQEATRAIQQAGLDEQIRVNRESAAQAAVNQAFLEKKLTIEQENDRATEARLTRAQIMQEQANAQQLDLQYTQLQTQVAQFNTQQQMAVDVENNRRTEANAARRERIATDIGTTAQDAGSRGKLAAQLLAMQTGGEQVDEMLARGGDFFTDESLVPLTGLLGERTDAAKGANFLSYNPVATPARPAIPTPFSQQSLIQAPGQSFTQLGTAAGSSIGPGTANQAPPPTTVSQMPGYNYTPQDGNPFQDLSYIETPDTSFDDGSSGTGYSVSESDFQDLLDSLSPDTPVQNFAKGGMAQGAYMGDEEGPELHIPLGPGEALVIPHDQVKNFLRSASTIHKGKQQGKQGKPKGKQAPAGADMDGMGIGAMADGGLFSQGTIFGSSPAGDQTETRNFLREALKRGLSGTPWERGGRAPTPIEVSAPGTDPLVQELGGSLSALGTGTPSDYFLRRARLLTPQGITAAAGGARRTS